MDIVARDIGVIAMKTSADGRLLREGMCTIGETLRHVWSIEPEADLALEWYKT